MNKKEFESRIGSEVSNTTFDYANRVYMAAGDMDKEDFCADWKKNKVEKSNIVSALTLEVEGLNAALKSANSCYERAEQGLRDFAGQMADFLIIQAEKWSASDLRRKAIDLVGNKEYLRRKIEMGFDLWKEDRELIVKYLAD